MDETAPRRPLIPAAVWAVAVAVALSAFSFHAYVYAREGSWEGYFPMLHHDEVNYCMYVALAERGRLGGDYYLFEHRETPNFFEKLPPNAFAVVAGALGVRRRRRRS